MRVLERWRGRLRRWAGIAFVIIWTATGAQLLATGRPGNEIFWLFYVAVWAWYLFLVVLPNRQRRLTKN